MPFLDFLGVVPKLISPITNLIGSVNSDNVQKDIADENLNYQKARNLIEDARYADETSYNRAFAMEDRDYQRAFAEDERDYNRAFAMEDRDYQRAFAEDERDYNRALQQTIFDREDTAIERQIQSLSKFGINPLSQNLSGLGAGSLVSSSLPTSAQQTTVSTPSSSVPGLSSRGGQALNNTYKKISGLLSLAQPLFSLSEAFNDFQTGNLQRDSLALQNDRMMLENSELASDLGLNYSSNVKNPRYHTALSQTINGVSPFGNTFGYAKKKKANDIREWEGKQKYDLFDFDSDLTRNIKTFGNLDFNQLIENVLTNARKLGNRFDLLQ